MTMTMMDDDDDEFGHDWCDDNAVDVKIMMATMMGDDHDDKFDNNCCDDADVDDANNVKWNVKNNMIIQMSPK